MVNFDGLPSKIEDDLRLMEANVYLMSRDFKEATESTDDDRSCLLQTVVNHLTLILATDRDIGEMYWERITRIEEVNAICEAYQVGAAVVANVGMKDMADEIYYHLKYRLAQFMPSLPMRERWHALLPIIA
jgi:hypothetical protein